MTTVLPLGPSLDDSPSRQGTYGVPPEHQTGDLKLRGPALAPMTNELVPLCTQDSYAKGLASNVFGN